MQVLDSQVHIVGPDTPERPWVADLQGAVGGALGASTARHFGKDALISAEEMLAAMGAAGVHGGVLVVSTHYGFDNRHSLYAAGHLDALETMVRRFDGLVWLIDHLGLAQPPVLTPDDPPFARLPQVLALAEVPGVTVKLSGIAALSREAYPFADLRAPLDALLQAFGARRLLWGSDWTRTKSLLPYAQNLSFLADLGALSADEQAMILEDNLRRIAGWDAAGG